MEKGDQDKSSVLKAALARGWVGGTSGAAAMTVQVCSLMWMRTIMNYQYRHGSSTTEAMRTLWQQGKLRRFYRGIGPALLQGPLARFGDTAANVAVLSYLEKSDMPLAAKTGVASITSASWRIFIMPIDAVKTTMQAEGAQARSLLKSKMNTQGPVVLWHGAGAAATATAVGHFPWFYTFNLLQSVIPTYTETHKKLARNAAIGFTASVVSDTISNSLRVIKTVRQTYHEPISYSKTVQLVVSKDGVLGLFGRGLKTRIMANGVQGLMFSVLWKWFQELQEGDRNKE